LSLFYRKSPGMASASLEFGTGRFFGRMVYVNT
jgi:hypothetical protein